jgi:sporulation protein YlmC with PRC-barrel domain
MDSLKAFLGMLCAAFLCIAGLPAFAQMDQPQDADEQQAQSGQQMEMITADQILGQTLYDPDGEAIGNVSRIYIGRPQGEVKFLVVSGGGFLGFGGQSFLIPAEAVMTQDGQYSLQMTRDELQDAPEVTSEDLQAEQLDPELIGETYAFFGLEEPAEELDLEIQESGEQPAAGAESEMMQEDGSMDDQAMPEQGMMEDQESGTGMEPSDAAQEGAGDTGIY